MNISIIGWNRVEYGMNRVEDVLVPLDVPKRMRQKYLENYLKITKNSGRLMLY